MAELKLSNKRSANYTAAETECLLSHLETNPGLLEARLGVQFKTAEEYNQAWEEVAEKVTVVGGYFGTKRSAYDLKRKWSDLKHRVKAKVASIAMDAQRSDGSSSTVKLTEADERVLALMTELNDMQPEKSLIKHVKGAKVPSLRVFSFQNDSNSQDGVDSDNVDDGNDPIESQLVTEIKSTPSSEDKKRRISEAFNAANSERSFSTKRAKQSTEEEQLLELCHSQRQMFNELSSIKDILKKCQLSVEKLALLKRAELRLKCAKYGVEFDDLFD